jgi:hypothetical protein
MVATISPECAIFAHQYGDAFVYKLFLYFLKIFYMLFFFAPSRLRLGCLTNFMKSSVMTGLPHPVSPPGASKVLPIFQPSFILAASATALLAIPVASAVLVMYCRTEIVLYPGTRLCVCLTVIRIHSQYRRASGS